MASAELPSCSSIREKFSWADRSWVEHCDSLEQQEKSEKQDEEEDGILEYNSLSDDGDIPSLERGVNYFYSEEVPASEEVFASTANLWSVNFSLFTL